MPDLESIAPESRKHHVEDQGISKCDSPGHCTAWPRWLPSISETQTVGWTAPNKACTTALPRLGRITCSTASVPTKTHSHQVLPVTRAEVSSEQTTGLAVTVSRMAAAAASNGSRARANMLL